jgi:hypothetical protein
MLGMVQALILESASRPLKCGVSRSRQERPTTEPQIQATIRKPSSRGGPDHFDSNEKRSETL